MRRLITLDRHRSLSLIGQKHACSVEEEDSFPSSCLAFCIRDGYCAKSSRQLGQSLYDLYRVEFTISGADAANVGNWNNYQVPSGHGDITTNC